MTAIFRGGGRGERVLGVGEGCNKGVAVGHAMHVTPCPTLGYPGQGRMRRREIYAMYESNKKKSIAMCYSARLSSPLRRVPGGGSAWGRLCCWGGCVVEMDINRKK